MPNCLQMFMGIPCVRRNETNVAIFTPPPFVSKLMSLTIKVCVDAVFHVGSGAEVDELQVQSAEVHQQVLILDVAMDDALGVAGDDGLHHLAEKVAGQLLLELPVLGDEVKQVLARRRLVHNVDEAVVALVKVEQADHSGDHLHLGQELQLQWDSSTV